MEIEYQKSDNFTMFNPAFIDDYGFTPEEFRVFARIMRRCLGSDGKCFESIPHMAKSLMISERLVRRALNVLLACRAIKRTIRPGYSDLLDFNPCDRWLPADQLPIIREKLEGEAKKKDRERKKKITPVGNATPCNSATTTPCVSATTPLADPQDEGSPLKEDPFKEEGERTRARAGEITLGKISGVPVIDYSGDAADKKLYFEEIVDGLRVRLNSPNILPKEHEWVSAIKFAYENQHPPDAFLKTFDNLLRLKKLKRKDWRINAAMIENNIGTLDDLILEIKLAEEKQNGQRDETRKRTDTDRPNKYQASHESGADTLARLRGRIRKPERREPEPAAV